MPPVLGPLSPSPTRLWSWLVAIGSTFSPSTMTMKLASSPSRNSSMTTRAPASPKALPESMSRTASSASCRVMATITPLPAARPSALTTIGAPAFQGMGAQVGQGRLDFGEVLVVGSGDLVAGQEVLGEGLGAFQLGGGGGRAEDVQAARAEQVDHALHQRRFRADDGQLDVLLGEVGQLLDGQHVDGHVFTLGFGGGAGVARGNEDLLDALVLRHFPGQGVLAAAAADDQYVHVSLLAGGEKDGSAILLMKNWATHN